MIKAKQETVDVPVTTITKQKVITLQLSPEVAQFLFDVTGKISGDMTLSRRKFSDELRRSLKELPCINREYTNKDGSVSYGAPDITIGMNFKNY